MIRDILELLYFLSGPVIALGVFYAYKQHKQYKSESNSRKSRDIANSTIRDLYLFSSEIEPLYKNYMNSLGKNTSFIYENVYDDIKDEKLYKTSLNYKNSINNDSVKIATEIILLLHKFSLSYTFQLSDEEKAKPIIGLKFIEIFDNTLFMISILTKENSNNYKKLYELYLSWNNEFLLAKQDEKIEIEQKRKEELEKFANNPLKPI